jgi:single-strand selective monofunctional uracil DNA glycosylase
MDLVGVAAQLCEQVARLKLVHGAVTHVYNPLAYAWEPHCNYLQRYGRKKRRVVLVGMNPGPWGMVQTGVPFGDVFMVRDWLGITGTVGKPRHPHPKRPVLGFECRRQEISGRRLWGWARDRFGTPSQFFRQFFVLNYCPLCFFESSGRNRTPDRLPAADRKQLYEPCDHALAAVIQRLQPTHLLGVGGFATARVSYVLNNYIKEGGNTAGIVTGRIPHPSPANPHSRNWAAEVEAGLRELGIAIV